MKTGSRLKKEFFARGKANDCPVYDMHGHMGPWYGAYFPWARPEAVVNAMDRAGVRLFAFCHHASLFAPDIGNAANVKAVRKYPERLRAYCAVNPTSPDIVARDLKTFNRYRDVYVGFKFLADYHECPITDGRYKPAWEFAEREGLLVLVHTWGESRYDNASLVREAAGQYGNAKILVGHSCHGAWDEAVALARDFPNLYLELCAVLDERGILEKFVAEAGSEKLLFGTDMPWFGYHYSIGAVLGADISDEDRRNILYRNARKLLGDLTDLP
jgi:predicted TIM-barrel fold metal-dependent hydrolase